MHLYATHGNTTHKVYLTKRDVPETNPVKWRSCIVADSDRITATPRCRGETVQNQKCSYGFNWVAEKYFCVVIPVKRFFKTDIFHFSLFMSFLASSCLHELDL